MKKKKRINNKHKIALDNFVTEINADEVQNEEIQFGSAKAHSLK